MIYLDHNATTPLDETVLETMVRVLRDVPANASSVHRAGQRARAAIDDAREKVAATLGASPRDLTFTSGGTEANNLALRGLWAARRPGRDRIVVSAVEHPAVLETARALGRDGARVVELPVDAEGALRWEALEAAIDDTTALVSVMWANNETGIVHPIERLGLLCRDRGVTLHVDAVQAFGRLPIDVSRQPVDLLSVSAHKIHGPKGAGALWARSGIRLLATVTGGHQERGRRGGTENVAAIAGFGVAATLAAERMEGEMARLTALRARLEQALARIEGTRLLGSTRPRLPNTVAALFADVEGEALLMGLDLEGVCVSSGSACTSGSLEPSHVLRAMGVEDRWARGAVRFSLGRGNTAEEIDRTAALVAQLVPRLR